ncbi:hypothetical protein L3V83_00520 [Thiotrichales bacterium 19X7-9]|nr:hypothetical protein [Thiotrichales bacterium 19X7-9]
MSGFRQFHQIQSLVFDLHNALNVARNNTTNYEKGRWIEDLQVSLLILSESINQLYYSNLQHATQASNEPLFKQHAQIISQFLEQAVYILSHTNHFYSTSTAFKASRARLETEIERLKLYDVEDLKTIETILANIKNIITNKLNEEDNTVKTFNALGQAPLSYVSEPHFYKHFCSQQLKHAEDMPKFDSNYFAIQNAHFELFNALNIAKNTTDNFKKIQLIEDLQNTLINLYELLHYSLLTQPEVQHEKIYSNYAKAMEYLLEQSIYILAHHNDNGPHIMYPDSLNAVKDRLKATNNYLDTFGVGVNIETTLFNIKNASKDKSLNINTFEDASQNITNGKETGTVTEDKPYFSMHCREFINMYQPQIGTPVTGQPVQVQTANDIYQKQPNFEGSAPPLSTTSEQAQQTYNSPQPLYPPLPSDHTTATPQQPPISSFNVDAHAPPPLFQVTANQTQQMQYTDTDEKELS